MLENELKLGSFVRTSGGLTSGTATYGIIINKQISKIDILFYKVWWSNGTWSWKKWDHIKWIA